MKVKISIIFILIGFTVFGSINQNAIGKSLELPDVQFRLVDSMCSEDSERFPILDSDETVCLELEIILDSRNLEEVQVIDSEFGQPLLPIRLRAVDADYFYNFTASHIDGELAIVISGEVILKATIAEAINSELQVSGLTPVQLEYLFPGQL